MKSRSKNLVPLFLIFLASACLIGLAALWLATWLTNRTPTTEELLQPLTAAQRQCVQQIVNGRTLIYTSQQLPENKLVLGYTGDKDLYVAVVNEGPDSACNTEFNEKVFDCYQSYLHEYCTNYRLSLQKVESVELTGDAPVEVYVWFDIQGISRRSGGRYQFYVKQSDGSFKMALELRLCAGLSSLEINRDSQKIIATDDMGCYMSFQGRKEYIEYILPKGTPQKIRDDFDPF
jgi:hypothetical protein